MPVVISIDVACEHAAGGPGVAAQDEGGGGREGAVDAVSRGLLANGGQQAAVVPDDVDLQSLMGGAKEVLPVCAVGCR
jgi:hypothetical protein